MKGVVDHAFETFVVVVVGVAGGGKVLVLGDEGM